MLENAAKVCVGVCGSVFVTLYIPSAVLLHISPVRVYIICVYVLQCVVAVCVISFAVLFHIGVFPIHIISV